MDGSGQVAAEPFYTDPDCQRIFRAYMAAVVRRVNSLTGVRYRCAADLLGWARHTWPCSMSIFRFLRWMLRHLSLDAKPASVPASCTLL